MKKEYDGFQWGRNERNHPKTDGPWTNGCFCTKCETSRATYIADKLKKNYPLKVAYTKEPSPELVKASRIMINAGNIAEQAINLLVKKNKDYGPNSISRAPGGAMNGLLVRLHDKIERADHLIRNNTTPNNESVRDTFIDILNYAIISLLVLDDKWDKLK